MTGLAPAVVQRIEEGMADVQEEWRNGTLTKYLPN